MSPGRVSSLKQRALLAGLVLLAVLAAIVSTAIGSRTSRAALFIVDDQGVPRDGPVDVSVWSVLEQHDWALVAVAGRLELPALARGDWGLFVHVGAATTTEDTRLALPQEREQTVVLQRPGVFAGVVVDRTGAPVEGALVKVSSGVAWWRENDLSATCDARGAFRLDPIHSGRVNFFISFPGQELLESYRFVELEPAQTLEGVLFAVAPPGEVRLQVLDPGGAPATAAEVALYPGWLDFDEQEETAGADGTILVDNLEIGRRWVRATNGFEVGMAPIEIRPGERTQAEVRLAPLEPLEQAGRMTAAGIPLAGAEFVLAREGPLAAGEFVRGTTDVRGEFSVTLPRDGRYIARVAVDGDWVTQIPVRMSGAPLALDLPTGRLHVTTRIDLSDLPATPAGQAARERLDGVVPRVWLRRLDPPHDLDPEAGYYFEAADTFKYLAAGRYLVFAFERDDRSREPSDPTLRGATVVEIEDGESVQLELLVRPRASVEVRMQHPDGRPPAEPVVVLATDKDGVVLETTLIDPLYSGRATLPVHLEAAYLRALGSGTSARVALPSLRPGRTYDARLLLEAGGLLRVRAPTSATIRARDADGLDVSGLGPHVGRSHHTTPSFTTERTFGPLPYGTYHVSARAADGWEVARDVELLEAQVTVKLEL